MKRRDFLKGFAATGAGVALSGGIVGMSTAHAQKGRGKAEDFGEIKSLKVHCISETSWFDNATLGRDIKNAGGINSNQYDVSYDEENLGGYAALVEVEALDGTKTKYLLDSGWSRDWMDYVFAKDGIDTMLKNKEIDTLIISHDHIDHYFGLESTLKHQPDIKIYFPGTSMKKSFELLKGADFSSTPGCPKNTVPHTGELIVTEENKLYKLQDGVAIVFFDCPATLQVRGENVMYFKIKDKGYVTVTGCCHPGILTLFNYSRRNFKDGDKNYGCYGGLHISPFEDWDPRMDDLIQGLKAMKMTKIGCNHCTGWIWAEKAAREGLAIVEGTDKNLSYKKVGTLARAKTSNVYLGNGDDIVF
ncbi:MAG: MBL fold metallo-hydrolase [Syntrophales bacterium]|jgi:7,8-dihydropterin-6-yl-methyl-4-(beta-D-ribofuranosyl)aminobenzene 5'-phosphate synthase|nr:MBL fold metallo-hydrolase [Syntrophales bacterium]MCK9527636.1 MBL fold metallo-hydrolase [Syntrophales bacterium]MDX9922253.1 MBL fold metallo-hydrolase [Syntrophales bacterium]